jgi:hypothetical protein
MRWAMRRADPGALIVSARYPTTGSRVRTVPLSQIVVDLVIDGSKVTTFTGYSYGVWQTSMAGKEMALGLLEGGTSLPGSSSGGRLLANVVVPSFPAGIVLFEFRVGWGRTRTHRNGCWELSLWSDGRRSRSLAKGIVEH